MAIVDVREVSLRKGHVSNRYLAGVRPDSEVSPTRARRRRRSAT